MMWALLTKAWIWNILNKRPYVGLGQGPALARSDAVMGNFSLKGWFFWRYLKSPKSVLKSHSKVFYKRLLKWLHLDFCILKLEKTLSFNTLEPRTIRRIRLNLELFSKRVSHFKMISKWSKNYLKVSLS